MIDSENISDKIGAKTLAVISQADNFNQWMYQTIKPYCTGKILEIGSGIGNISEFFFEDDYEIMLTDFRKEYCDLLTEKYGNNRNCLGINTIDLVHPEFEELYKNYLDSFETVFALNVIEHISDDVRAIANAKKLLKNQGNLIILVPAYQSLYNKFDKGLGHYRRYTTNTLSQVFDKSGLSIINKEYFNAVGILGWFISGNILGKESIPQGQMSIYNKLVPVIKIFDKIIKGTIGLSVLVIGKK